MSMLSDTKLVFLDVETTGLSPAMGDRVIEIGMIVCRGATEINRSSHLINPGRPIPRDAHRIHGISDEEVSQCPPFMEIAAEVESTLIDSWIVGHNVRFDIGFIAMELQLAGRNGAPLGCSDTCQLASALWQFPNYQLATVVNALRIPTTRLHRALDDATVTREVFHRAVDEIGGWREIEASELMKLHRYNPAWPADPNGSLPKPLFDSLANGRSLSIQYENAEGQSSSRVIRPETCFVVGRSTYLRAYCENARDLRTFRLDRISLLDSENQPPSEENRDRESQIVNKEMG